MSKHLLKILGLRSKPNAYAVKSSEAILTNGLLNLPAELWTEIFTHTAALVIRTSSVSAELQDTESTYHALCHEISALSDGWASQSQSLFRTRRKIVLVCKAWHQLGIHTLYSHMKLNQDRLEPLKSLYRCIKRHPSLASSVVRLSVSGGQYGYNKKVDKEREQLLAKLLPLFTNVRIVVISTSSICKLHSLLRPKVLILYQDYGGCRPGGSYRDISDLPNAIAPALQFASQAETLSFKHLEYCAENQWEISTMIFPPIEFPNLVNLHLQFKAGEVMEGAVDGWSLPRLRTFSVTCRAPYRWMNFIRRHAENLEALEIIPAAWQPYYDIKVDTEQVGRIQFPKLLKLCLYTSRSRENAKAADFYFNLFFAPRLVQFYLQIDCLTDWTRCDYPTGFLDHHDLKKLGDRFREIWPKMKELTVSSSKEWVYERLEFVPKTEEQIQEDIEWMSERGRQKSKQRERWNARGYDSDDISDGEREEAIRASHRRRVIYYDTEEDRARLLKGLVNGWVEAGITAVFKHKRATEFVFPRKEEGGIDAMVSYHSPVWPPDFGIVYMD